MLLIVVTFTKSLVTSPKMEGEGVLRPESRFHYEYRAKKGGAYTFLDKSKLFPSKIY